MTEMVAGKAKEVAGMTNKDCAANKIHVFILSFLHLLSVIPARAKSFRRKRYLRGMRESKKTIQNMVNIAW
jgi:hypothetical protein